MVKILVVDDDPDFVLNSRNILEAEGYEVIDACNGSQALPLMRRERPDLILLDVMMSTTLEGLEVCREVRSDPDLQDVPIIMISSIASSEYASEFPEDELIPIDTWMPKPVEPAALLRAIRRFVE
jgi:two-component system, OmpR family, alkaline phosphatase synthesis response regulator PhoP